MPDSVPTVPTGLAASAISATSTMLSWQASSVPGGGFVTGYAIFVDGEQVATTDQHELPGHRPDGRHRLSVLGGGDRRRRIVGAEQPDLGAHDARRCRHGDDGHMFSPYIDMAMSKAADLAGISATSGIDELHAGLRARLQRGHRLAGLGRASTTTRCTTARPSCSTCRTSRRPAATSPSPSAAPPGRRRRWSPPVPRSCRRSTSR